TSPGCDQEDSNIFFDPGSGGNTDHDGYGKMLLLTFYLKPPEAEEVFKALEEGMLNLAICPCAAGSWMNHQAG
ncbi:MAG: hypothetical protein JW770_01710, partial [Actinobacteria bacterium]|nr:hypothetical protein [Actinomycetota bacterium]